MGQMKHTTSFIFDKSTVILEITIHNFALNFTYVIFHQVSVQRMNTEPTKPPENRRLVIAPAQCLCAINDSPTSHTHSL